MRLIVETAVFASVCLLTALAYWLAWNNRASDKVVSAVLPITTAAAVSVFTAVLIFGALPDVSTRFATVFVANSDHFLSSYPRSTDRNSEEARAMLERFDAREHGLGAMPEEKVIFHHALQRQIVGNLTYAYRKSWRNPRVEFDLPSEGISYSPEAAPEDPKPLDAAALRQILGRSLLNEVNDRATLALPPATTLTVNPPADGAKPGVISLKNPFCEITIETRHINTSNELGVYGLILNDGRKYDILVYQVAARASFSRLRPGNPQMADYRRWAGDILATVQSANDETVIWPRLRDQILFQKIAGAPQPQAEGAAK